MSKLIATMNMTLDGFCDHTVMIADEELHQHYTEVLSNAGALLYGRVTYQLMEDFWPTLVKNPSGDKPMDDFAVAIQNVPKIVFSHTLNKVDWENSTLAEHGLKEEVLALKKKANQDIFVGSPSLIATLTKLNLFDEYQLCVHPVIVGSGLPLFKNINDRSVLELFKTKTFGSGAILLYYKPTKE